MNTKPETNPAPVPLTAQQAGKVAALRVMAAPEVWTERMLVRGGAGFSPPYRRFVFAASVTRSAISDRLDPLNAPVNCRHNPERPAGGSPSEILTDSG